MLSDLTISHQSEWLRSKSLQAINAGKGVEKREPSYTVGGNANLVQPLWRTVWRFLKNLEIELPYEELNEARSVVPNSLPPHGL